MDFAGDIDVMAIRIDTADAVDDFLALLAAQAAEGETRAPAHPANRAIYRELAPFRLVEYDYVEGGVGAIESVLIGFADGALFPVAEEIPEAVVDGMLVPAGGRLAPVYVYIVLARPVQAVAADLYLHALSDHVGRPLVAMIGDDAHAFISPHGESIDPGRLQSWLDAAATEKSRHLSKAALAAIMAGRSRGPKGEAYAAMTSDFARHILEFPSAAARDDFVAWTRRLCDWMFATHSDWCAIGFREVVRPAEPAGVPAAAERLARPEAPSLYDGGRPWGAFEGESDRAMPDGLEAVSAYWAHVKAAIDRAEAAP